MNLSKMTLRDLKIFRDRLDIMIVYGSHLERIQHDADAELAFHLEPGEYVTVTLPFRMPDLGDVAAVAEDPIELVEREADDRPMFVRNVFPAAGQVAETAVKAPGDGALLVPELAIDANGADVQGDKPAAEPPKPAPAPEPSKGLVTGPLSDEERQLIGLMVDQGSGAAEIAAKLRRRVQTVALLLNRAEAGKAQIAVQPSGNSGALPAAAAPDLKVKPAAPSVAKDEPAPVKAAVSPAPSPVEERIVRPAWWHEVSAVLDAVGHKGGWTPARDLELVEEATKGTPWEIVADQLGVEKREAKARFIALTPDGASFERQSRLIEVLRSKIGDTTPAQV